MSLRTLRQYPVVPQPPQRSPLPPMVSVVLPLARTNLITNPSFETATTGWTAGASTSIARSTVYQYHGVYSLAVTYGAIAGSVHYDLSLTSGTVYAFSIKFIEPTAIGRTFKISIANNSGVDQASYLFTSTGRWQWVWVIYTANATATHQLHVDLVTNPASGIFYLDGAQLETISDGILQPTTYIDGDQLGLLVGQQPPAYGWNGTPHASTSYRTILTRAGGYLVNLSAYNFLLTAIVGLGMAVPNNVSIPYTVLDGARYQRTTKPPRTIALPGRWQSDSPREQFVMASDMRQAFDRDLVPLQQPLILQVEPQDECGNAIGDFANIQCIYAGGLEGNDGAAPIEDVAPAFTMYVPFLLGGDAGTGLSAQQTVTNANGIVQRSPAGVWSSLGTGVSGGTAIVTSLTYGLDGTLYIGGNFTDVGGSGADYIAKYSGGAWSVVKSATSINNTVYALATGPDGRIYVGGDFTNADGIAAADFIAVYDPVGNTWAALGTGAASVSVFALAFDRSGNLYAGGSFTSMGGVGTTAGLAKWNGSAWSSIGSAAGGGASVSALAADPATGYVYAAGSFLTLGGVACVRIGRYNGTAWSALSSGLDSTGSALAFGPNNRLYVGGNFVVAGGVTVNYVAAWNGAAFSPLGSGLDNAVNELTFDAAGVLWAGGQFGTAGGVTLPDRGARWNGSAWIPLDIDFPSVATIAAMAPARDGTVTFAYNTSGSAVSAAITAVTSSAPSFVWPTLTINGPSSGTSRIYQLVNYTTGFGVWLNLTLSAGEVATLNFDPQNPSFRTTFQGDITSRILPGSQSALMYLAPGANSMSFFAASSTVTATLSWKRRYNGVADLVN